MQLNQLISEFRLTIQFSPDQHQNTLPAFNDTIGQSTFMKVFISYGSATDQVTALRLQALAAVNGLKAYVPPADTRMVAPSAMAPESRQKLSDTDVILGGWYSRVYGSIYRRNQRRIYPQEKYNRFVRSDL